MKNIHAAAVPALLPLFIFRICLCCPYIAKKIVDVPVAQIRHLHPLRLLAVKARMASPLPSRSQQSRLPIIVTLCAEFAVLNPIFDGRFTLIVFDIISLTGCCVDITRYTLQALPVAAIRLTSASSSLLLTAPDVASSAYSSINITRAFISSKLIERRCIFSICE